MFKVGEQYSAREITKGEFRGIYDQLIVLVDGRLDYLTDWHSELQEELKEYYKEEGRETSDKDIYEDAWDDLLNNIPVIYEDYKDVFVFRGIPPVPEGRSFDFYSTYECTERMKR